MVVRISRSSALSLEIWESLSWDLLGDVESSHWENEHLYTGYEGLPDMNVIVRVFFKSNNVKVESRKV